MIPVLTVGDEGNLTQGVYFVLGNVICFAQEPLPEMFSISSTRCSLN